MRCVEQFAKRYNVGKFEYNKEIKMSCILLEVRTEKWNNKKLVRNFNNEHAQFTSDVRDIFSLAQSKMKRLGRKKNLNR